MRIALFDSGIGGLSVLQAFLEANIEAEYHYVADSAHVPYGIRSRDYIDQRVTTLFNYLHHTIGIDLFIIACNTATATSANHLRSLPHSIPIIGVEPAVKPASLSTKTGHIIVAATESTLQSDRLARLIATYSHTINVHKLSGGAWVELVESGHLNDERAKSVIEASLQPFMAYPVDQFILGCTHFPFLTAQLSTILPADVTIINPAKPIANHALTLLNRNGILPSNRRSLHCYTTGDQTQFIKQLTQLNFEIDTVTQLSI